MANIIERPTTAGEKRYVVRVRKKGHPVQTATFKRKTDAQRWARQVEADIEAGRHFKTAEAKRRTFGQLADRYLAEILPGKSEQLQKVQASQLAFWRGHFGDYPLADITPARVMDGTSRLAKTTTRRGEMFAPATINRYLTLLSHVFTTAEAWQWIEASPVKKIHRGKEPPGRTRWLVPSSANKTHNSYP